MDPRKSKNQNFPNFLIRLWHVWANFRFLKNILTQEKTSGKTWAFWFFWNSAFALVFTVALYFFGVKFADSFVLEQMEQVPADLEFTMKDGFLRSNMEEPLIIQEEGTTIAIDLKKQKFSEDNLPGTEGLFIFEDRFISQRGVKREEVIFADIVAQNPELSGQEFTIDKATAKNFWQENKTTIYNYATVLAFIFIWIWLCLIRLLAALWWALIFWLYAKIWGIQNFDYGTSYLSVLSFYSIPLAFETVFLISGVLIPFSTIILFALIFSLNFYYIKKVENPQIS